MQIINIYDNKSRQKAIELISCLDCIKIFELKITQKNKKRTLSQNNALHLFFQWIADELNNLGLTFNYNGLKGMEMEIPYTMILVKETIWKPIQKTMFEIDSTTELDSDKINQILDVLIFFFAKNGISIYFPNRFDVLIENLNTK